MSCIFYLVSRSTTGVFVCELSVTRLTLRHKRRRKRNKRKQTKSTRLQEGAPITHAHTTRTRGCLPAQDTGVLLHPYSSHYSPCLVISSLGCKGRRDGVLDPKLHAFWILYVSRIFVGNRGTPRQRVLQRVGKRDVR